MVFFVLKGGEYALRYLRYKLENTCMQKPSPCALADKTIVFSEHEVSKVVVIVTRYFLENILYTNEKVA
jgi:hypothetical protein